MYLAVFLTYKIDHLINETGIRARSDSRTCEYVARRTAEGLSTKEIFRCLKRYIIRELYPLIMSDLKSIMPINLT